MFSQEFDDEDPLFSLAFHPEAPEYVLGFASGRVACYKYNEAGPQQKWSTKRHKYSCRSLAYSQDGQSIFSGGSDKVIKKCNSKDGRVTAKAKLASAITVMTVTEKYLLVGDEDGNASILNIDSLATKIEYTDLDTGCITSIYKLPSPPEQINGKPNTSPRETIVVGGDSRVVHLNVKKQEPLAVSEDQEDEILCGCIVSDHRSAFGMSEGVITVWKNNYFEDQQNRVRIVKDGSVDCIIASDTDDVVLAGTSDGTVARADLRSGRVTWRGVHSETEEVSMLDWDHEWRLVTGSMNLLKVWPAKLESVPAPQSKKAKKTKKTEKKSSGESINLDGSSDHSDSDDAGDSSDLGDASDAGDSDDASDASASDSDDGSDSSDESDLNDSNDPSEESDSAEEDANEQPRKKQRN